MSGLGGLRGVSAGQDSRFGDKLKKVLKDLDAKGKLPKELSLKVDLKKVNWPVSGGHSGVAAAERTWAGATTAATRWCLGPMLAIPSFDTACLGTRAPLLPSR